MHAKQIICADAASENCPCLLAETNDCLVCSRLQGKNECDCKWAGVCIYNEFMQNGGRRALTRAGKTFEITDIRKSGSFVMMTAACGRGFALSCLHPGTHVFVRPEELEKYYDVPLSLLDADYTAGTLTVCFRVISAKTKALSQCAAGSSVIVRGPYRNGIVGLPRRLSGRRILIAAAGAGLVPAIFSSRLLSENNSVKLMTCDPEIPECAARMISDGEYDWIIVLGNCGFINTMRGLAAENSSAQLAFSNNAIMSCGEGVCGACSSVSDNGRRIPACKCANPELLQPMSSM